jgi:hypothetical protein
MYNLIILCGNFIKDVAFKGKYHDNIFIPLQKADKKWRHFKGWVHGWVAHSRHGLSMHIHIALDPAHGLTVRRSPIRGLIGKAWPLISCIRASCGVHDLRWRKNPRWLSLVGFSRGRQSARRDHRRVEIVWKKLRSNWTVTGWDCALVPVPWVWVLHP